jgi:hypothetical protein
MQGESKIEYKTTFPSMYAVKKFFLPCNAFKPRRILLGISPAIVGITILIARFGFKSEYWIKNKRRA